MHRLQLRFDRRATSVRRSNPSRVAVVPTPYDVAVCVVGGLYTYASASVSVCVSVCTLTLWQINLRPRNLAQMLTLAIAPTFMFMGSKGQKSRLHGHKVSKSVVECSDFIGSGRGTFVNIEFGITY